jgi:hypothetical protein
MAKAWMKERIGGESPALRRYVRLTNSGPRAAVAKLA